MGNPHRLPRSQSRKNSVHGARASLKPSVVPGPLWVLHTRAPFTPKATLRNLQHPRSTEEETETPGG